MAPGSQFREPMATGLLAALLARGLSYDDSDAPSFILPNEVDAKLQNIYAKAYSELTDVQMLIARGKDAGKSWRWIKHVLNHCPGRERFGTPFPDDANRHYSDNHV